MALSRNNDGEPRIRTMMMPGTSRRNSCSRADGQSCRRTWRNQTREIVGYEYFLTQFASAEGKNGGQFYTPRSVVRVLVELVAPYKGRVYDPCCGSAGMFVQSEKFVERHRGRIGDIAVYGQESNSTTRRLAMLNMAIRGIEGDLGPIHTDTFRRDLHKDLEANDVLANPRSEFMGVPSA